jgi:hypothetical protein
MLSAGEAPVRINPGQDSWPFSIVWEGNNEGARGTLPFLR